MSFQDLMNKARQDRAEGKTPGDFEQLPFGRYVCVLVDGALAKSKANNQQVWLEWLILEGEEKGKKDRQFHRLEGNKSEISIAILEKELTTMEIDTSVLGVEEWQEALRDVINSLVRRRPMVTYVVKKGKKKDPQGNWYVNKNVVDFMGDFEGDLPEDMQAKGSTQASAEASADNIPEAPQVNVEVGAKFKYKAPDGNTHVGEIKQCNYNEETVDFPFHKGIPLDNLVEPA